MVFWERHVSLPLSESLIDQLETSNRYVVLTGTNSVVGQLCFKNKQRNKLLEKEMRLVVTGDGVGSGRRESEGTNFQLQDKQVLGMRYPTR